MKQSIVIRIAASALAFTLVLARPSPRLMPDQPPPYGDSRSNLISLPRPPMLECDQRSISCG